MSCIGGCLRGDVPLHKLENFVFFETRIVQFVLLGAKLEQVMRSKKNQNKTKQQQQQQQKQFYGPD